MSSKPPGAAEPSAASPAQTPSASGASAPAARSAGSQRGIGLVWMLAALFATQPIATDLYLASLPALKRYFSVSGAQVQLTLTVYIACFALCQLVVGPLSDRFGRRPLVLGGASLYLLGSLIGALTPHFAGLIVARCMQAAGSSCTVIGARALVRDLYEPREGAHTLSMAYMIMSLVPMVAPVIGGFVEASLGWRANFGFISLLAAGILFASWRLLDETLVHKNPKATQMGAVFRNYLELARSPVLRAYTACTMFSYAALFSFISGSPFVMIEVLKVPTAYYGFCFGIVTIGFIVGSRLLQRRLPVIGIKRAVYRGGWISLASGAALFLFAWLRIENVAAFLVPMFGIMIAHGFIQPSTQAGAIGPFPEKAGAASALVGFGMYVGAATIGTVVGSSHNGTTLPLAAIIFAMSCGVALSAQVLVRRLPAQAA